MIRVERRIFNLGPMVAPKGIIFSKQPQIALCTDGCYYITKGPDPVLVAAELLGYSLAAQVGLPTPPFAIVKAAIQSGDRLFGSQKMDGRTDAGTILTAHLACNPEILELCAAFDIWTCNDDRNLLNLVSRSVGGRDDAEVELLAIDFESARILRGESALMLTGRDPKEFLAKNALAPFLRGRPLPLAMCTTIEQVPSARIEQIVRDVELALDRPLEHRDRIIGGLVTRQRLISSLVREAFNG